MDWSLFFIDSNGVLDWNIHLIQTNSANFNTTTYANSRLNWLSRCQYKMIRRVIRLHLHQLQRRSHDTPHPRAQQLFTHTTCSLFKSDSFPHPASTAARVPASSSRLARDFFSDSPPLVTPK